MPLNKVIEVKHSFGPCSQPSLLKVDSGDRRKIGSRISVPTRRMQNAECNHFFRIDGALQPAPQSSDCTFWPPPDSRYCGGSGMNAIQPVYMELVDFVARGSTPEEVANFRPSPEAQRRV